MTSFPEQITVINEVTEELMLRMEDAINKCDSSSFITNPINQKYLVSVLKKFPDFRLEQEKGQNPIQSAAGALLAEFESAYKTLLDTMEYQRVFADICREISSTVTILKFDSNPAFVDGFMSMIWGFTRVMLMLESFENRKTCAAIYALSYRYSRNVNEPSFLKLASFFSENEAWRKRISEILAPVSSRICEAALSFSDHMTHAMDVAYLRKDGVLSLVQMPDKLIYPDCDPFLVFLVKYSNYINWILNTFLFNPGELAMTGAMDLLKTAIQETYVLPVFTNTGLEIYTELEKAFTSYKSQTIKLAKHKGVILDCGNFFSGAGLARRKSMRIYLRQELSKVLSIIQERPGLLGPKITVILAALSLAKKEIEFYFYTKKANFPKCKVKPPEGALKDKQVIQLIYLAMKVRNLVIKHRSVVQKYMVELLAERDYTKLYALFQSAKQNNVPFTSKILELLESMVNRLASIKMEDASALDLRDFRMNWYRIQCAFSIASSTVRFNSIKDLCTTMNVVYHKTRYIDDLDALMDEACSLKFLYHFGDEMMELWDESLMLTQGQAYYVDTFFELLAELPDVKDPSLKKARGEESVKLAKSYIGHISSNVLELLDFIFGKQGMKWIYSQTHPLQALAAHSVKGKKPAQSADTPRPGTESYFSEKQKLLPLSNAVSQLALIMSSLENIGEITIYNHKFKPLKSIFDGIGEYFSSRLREIMNIENENREKFVYVLNYISGFIQVLKLCDHSANVGIGEACRRMLLAHFYDRSGCTDEEKNNLNAICANPLIEDIATWFENFITKRLTVPGVVYSPLRKQFISKSTLPFKAEEYADLVEMKALATIVGPYGVRVIDERILGILKRYLEKIKDCLCDNRAVLVDMVKAFPQEAKYSECAKRLRGTDVLLTSAINVGIILELRSLLLDSLNEVLGERMPLAVECIKNVQKQYNQSVFQVTGYEECDKLAVEMGITSEAVDPYMRELLKKLNSTAEDTEIWKLLPMAFASTFFTPLWKEAAYKPNLDANLNNIHCMMATINTLIVNMEAISIQFLQAQATPDERYVVEQLRKFVEYSSIILLNLNTDASPLKELPLMFLFLGKFVSQCPQLTMNMLEECIPYALLRSIYLQVIEKKLTDEGADDAAF